MSAVAEGWAVWLTGLPSSGKSTIAKALARRLEELSVRVQILETDELRKVLTPNPRYTEEERDFFYNAMVYIGTLLVKNGVNVIFDATANRRRYRDRARKQIRRFAEVYVKCPLKVCMERDVKGIYKAALEGRAKTVPGLQAPYEEPLNPEVVVETDRMTVEECVERILRELSGLFGVEG